MQSVHSEQLLPKPPFFISTQFSTYYQHVFLEAPLSPQILYKMFIPKATFFPLFPRFYKGLPPLWLRQIPYTMMKFAAFERTVEFLYKHVVPVKRDELGKPAQLVVTFAAGYIAGVFCAVVSHPADSVVSKLNSDVGSTAWQAAKDLGMVGKW